MENKRHFCHGEIISDAHTGTSTEWKEIFYFFGFQRIRENKPLGIKDRFIAPVFFISVQSIEERNDDRAFWKAEAIKLVI